MKLAFAPILLMPVLFACSDEADTLPREPDNTGRNARDRDGETVTPTDQLENEADVALTAAVRRALTEDDALSFEAENIKVISRNGVVTLRGPVKDQAEKERIESKAKSVAGVKSIVNELETDG